MGRGFLPPGAGRARKRQQRRGDRGAGHGCEPEPEWAGAAGGLRAGGHREVPDRLVGAEAGRAGPRAGEARGRGRRRAPHTCAASRELLSPPLSPLTPPCVGPRALRIPPAAGRGPWDSVLGSVPGCAWWLRRLLLFCPGTSQAPRERGSRARRLVNAACGDGPLRGAWPPGWRGEACPVGAKQGTRGVGPLVLCECGFQNLLFSKNAPDFA